MGFILAMLSAMGFCKDKGTARQNVLSFSVNGVDFTMRLVEHGSFIIGDDAGSGEERPAHKVTLTKDYYIGQTQVTQELWTAVMDNNPSRFVGESQLPVEFVTWLECQDFIKKLNEMTPDKGGLFALPTEAEWEFAARGGKLSKGYLFAGSNDDTEVAWFDEGWDSLTHPVAQKKANELGLYDMSGNVWEMCADYRCEYSRQDAIDPVSPEKGECRVLRGGDSFIPAGNGHVSCRRDIYEDIRHPYCGLRLVFRPSAR